MHTKRLLQGVKQEGTLKHQTGAPSVKPIFALENALNYITQGYTIEITNKFTSFLHSLLLS